MSIAGPLGIINQFMATIGVLLAVTLSFIIPYTSDPEALTSNLWLIMFAFPALVSITQFLSFVVIFKYDTPKFYRNQNDQANYTKIMSLIYDENFESKN